MTALLPSFSKATSAAAKPEMQLLCCCVRHHIDAATVYEIQTLSQQEIDWALLLRKANAHGIVPLLYKSLNDACRDRIPPNIANELKAHFHLNALRNQYLSEELLRILSLLKANGVTAVPFKGPTLSVLAYGSLSSRQFGDLDILVREQDFLVAKDCLLAEGYRCGQRLHGIADIETQELALMKKWGEFPLSHPTKQVLIDLHSRLIAGEFPILSANFDLFWENLAPVSLLNGEVNTFCLEDLLLYLCVHGSKDFWLRLSWVCDVASLIHTHPQLNWQWVSDRAHALDCEQMLWLGISLAQDLLAVSIPEAAADRMQRVFKKQQLSAQIQRRILSGIFPRDTKYKKLQRFRFHGQLIDNRGDQLRYYLGCARSLLLDPAKPNVQDLKFVSLPPRVHFLYYLIRPIRLLSQRLASSSKRRH